MPQLYASCYLGVQFPRASSPLAGSGVAVMMPLL
jgi:hypothetical protein